MARLGVAMHQQADDSHAHADRHQACPYRTAGMARFGWPAPWPLRERLCDSGPRRGAISASQ